MPSTTITIGGTDIEVPEINIKTLKKVYPIIKSMEEKEVAASDPLGIEIVDDVLKFLSVILERSDKPMSAEELEETMTVNEMKDLRTTVGKVLAANGLAAPQGEVPPVAERASRSTGTSKQ